MKLMLRALLALTLCPAIAQTVWPGQVERDTVLHNFTFDSGDRLDAVRLHAITLGTVRQWLAPEFANEIFTPGKPLDARRCYVNLPDAIGRGGSAKPSNGLTMPFPHHRYTDMVRATYRQVTEELGVAHGCLVAPARVGGHGTRGRCAGSAATSGRRPVSRDHLRL